MMRILIFRQLLWLVFALSVLIFSFGISWQISKSVNFFYDSWYQTLKINDVIAKHVPKNTQGKRDFPRDNSELHRQKFADIVTAIHQQGYGLASISYINQNGFSQILLTPSEVLHLQDVANLIDRLSLFWWVNLFILLVLCYVYGTNKYSKTSYRRMVELVEIPGGKQKLISLLFLMLFVVLVFSVWGFTAIFYYLHTVVFPENHQWFFYYNDSLMATLMKAPDIFAAIAIQLTIIALGIAAVIDVMVARIQMR